MVEKSLSKDINLKWVSYPPTELHSLFHFPPGQQQFIGCWKKKKNVGEKMKNKMKTPQNQNRNKQLDYKRIKETSGRENKSEMVSPNSLQRVHSLIPNSVCSLYFSRSIWMLVLKKSNLALSCWDMEAMEFFILERQLLFRRRFILQEPQEREPSGIFGIQIPFPVQ